MMSRLTAVGAAAALLTIACSSSVDIPSDAVVFEATVETVSGSTTPGIAAQILAAHVDPNDPVQRSVVHVRANAVVKQKVGNIISTIPATDIPVGVTARFTIENVELRSNPRQVFALVVEF
jgi:hypothetical protein